MNHQKRFLAYFEFSKVFEEEFSFPLIA